MQICVIGWDFNKSLYQSLSSTDYDAFTVLHKKGDTQGVPFQLVPNVGLEWGAYDYFLQNNWDRRSPVLFMQDDITVKSPTFFKEVSLLKDDFVFIYDRLASCVANERLFVGTGQCFKTSSKFLDYYLDKYSGFWYDLENTGIFDDNGTQDKGIGRFIQRLKSIDKDTIMKVNNHILMQEYIIIN